MKKGKLIERSFVWSVGALAFMSVFFYTQSLIPFNNCDVMTQWIDSIIPSLFAFVAGIIVGYYIVLVANSNRNYRRRIRRYR